MKIIYSMWIKPFRRELIRWRRREIKVIWRWEIRMIRGWMIKLIRMELIIRRWVMMTVMGKIMLIRRRWMLIGMRFMIRWF
jgi:hypothetical protein